jgi:hypothetical protein
MIESRGVATVVVGLVRSHMEKSQVPRGLWVPFPLGRPFGEPEAPGFQRRVLTAALALLERTDGPRLLVDFPDDAPSMRDTDGWVPQVTVPPPPASLPTAPADWSAALETELASVIPHWEAARRRFGRTTVGNSRLSPAEWPAYTALFLAGTVPESPVPGVSASVVLRYVADDLKSLYAEAVQAHGPQPSSRQVNDWFWNGTMAGALLRALRTAALTSPSNGFNTAGSRFLVPMPWVARG